MTIQDAIAKVTLTKSDFTTTDIAKAMNEAGNSVSPYAVSQELKTGGYYFKVINNVRRYYPKPTIESYLRTLILTWDSSKPLTMKFVKNYLKCNQVTFSKSDFDHYFSKLGFEFTGQYNTENHKLYRVRKPGTHFSETSEEVVEIGNMHPNHIYNTILKKYSNILVKDCFTRSSEIYQLLKAYFLYDIKESVKAWFK